MLSAKAVYREDALFGRREHAVVNGATRCTNWKRRRYLKHNVAGHKLKTKLKYDPYMYQVPVVRTMPVTYFEVRTEVLWALYLPCPIFNADRCRGKTHSSFYRDIQYCIHGDWSSRAADRVPLSSRSSHGRSPRCSASPPSSSTKSRLRRCDSSETSTCKNKIAERFALPFDRPPFVFSLQCDHHFSM